MPMSHSIFDRTSKIYVFNDSTTIFIGNKYGIRFPLDKFPIKLYLSDLLDLSQAKMASLGLSDRVELDLRM